MDKIINNKISNFHRRFNDLLTKLKTKGGKAFFTDSLFQGTALEVYRKCGNPNCKCNKGGDNRHGPYMVIQTKINGKQKQVTLKKEEAKYFKMAQRYKWHMQNLKELRLVLKEIDSVVSQALDCRIIRDKNDKK